VDMCATLINLDCRKNLLTAIALNKLFHGLHNNDIYDFTKSIWIDNNQGRYGCDTTIAENKGWKIN